MNKKALLITITMVAGSLYASQALQDKDIKGFALAKALEANATKEQIKPLLKGANINTKNSAGVTPLMLAIEHPDYQVFELVLKQKPEIDAQDNYGRTALMRAVEFGSQNTVQKLLDAGADTHITDRYGRTIFELTPQYKGVKEIIVALRERQEKAGNSIAPRH